MEISKINGCYTGSYQISVTYLYGAKSLIIFKHFIPFLHVGDNTSVHYLLWHYGLHSAWTVVYYHMIHAIVRTLIKGDVTLESGG